ncbi:unnamed protein product [Calicophoron daubneyi]|uniref:eRF1 domain-containing protein n=1 Tax=Calicophoron daubneyi TaxID=300641 RepID=A0AAV2TVP0_CALDB
MEKRHNYVRKVAETATQLFITNDKPNIEGLVLAGIADFKSDLSQSDMFDQRLQAKLIKMVDISYGGENGFNQAIDLSADALSGVKFIQEKKLIQRYFDEISQDSGRYCFGVDDTLKALEMGAVETLIVWENLSIDRVILKATGSDGRSHSIYVPCQKACSFLMAILVVSFVLPIGGEFTALDCQFWSLSRITSRTERS